jgi:SAM-dependent methyltransferase
MVMAQCEECGLIQLVDGVPAEELMPPFDWISYNEPEGHLDDLVDIIVDLPGFKEGATVCGISFKDVSTLKRLEDRGASNSWLIEPESDLNIEDPRAGIETIQGKLTPDNAALIVAKHGQADIVIVRHVLEHAHDTARFMQAIKLLVAPNGHIVFEVPDCSRALETLDYSCPWEEHVLYFTQLTFEKCLLSGGFSPIRYECYPYPFENSLVGIVTTSESVYTPELNNTLSAKDRLNWQQYSGSLETRRTSLRKKLINVQTTQGKIALFGAGHLAAFYINILGLADLVEFVVDDNPNKKGLFMPGSRLPILGSGALVEKDIKLCLLSLSPESEEKVIQNNQGFIDQGGQFFSIFPSSERALVIGAA